MRHANWMRRTVLAGMVAASAAAFQAPAVAQEDPIRLGELFSYNRLAAFAIPYRNGWQMAVEDINEAGGVLGRPLEVISRDDGGTPGDAVRVAEELVSREDVALLFGTFLSNVGLAVSDFANQRDVVFVATEPLTDAMTMEAGNPYTFRIRPNTYMQTKMLVDAIGNQDIDRWAIVAPNYEYGQSAAENFKKLLSEVNPDAEIVSEQYPALGQLDAGTTIAAIAQAEPDGIFNALFAGDLAEFVREGNTRSLFEGKTVVSLLTGEPEYLLPLGDEAPEGWIVTGYPWDKVEGEAHQDFAAEYEETYDETPRLGSLLGYVSAQVIANAIETAGSLETEALQAAFEDLTTDTVIGPITIRGIDNQSTMGAWVGKTAVEDGAGTMTDFTYADGADYMFPPEAVEEAWQE